MLRSQNLKPPPWCCPNNADSVPETSHPICSDVSAAGSLLRCFSACFSALSSCIHWWFRSEQIACSSVPAELARVRFNNLTSSAKRAPIQSTRICRRADHSGAESESELFTRNWNTQYASHLVMYVIKGCFLYVFPLQGGSAMQSLEWLHRG